MAIVSIVFTDQHSLIRPLVSVALYWRIVSALFKDNGIVTETFLIKDRCISPAQTEVALTSQGSHKSSDTTSNAPIKNIVTRPPEASRQTGPSSQFPSKTNKWAWHFGAIYVTLEDSMGNPRTVWHVFFWRSFEDFSLAEGRRCLAGMLKISFSY